MAYKGERGGYPPPPKPKNVENVLFPKALFLVTNFPKHKIKIKNKIKIQFFYRIFIKNFQNFLKISNKLWFSSKHAKN